MVQQHNLVPYALPTTPAWDLVLRAHTHTHQRAGSGRGCFGQPSKIWVESSNHGLSHVHDNPHEKKNMYSKHLKALCVV